MENKEKKPTSFIPYLGANNVTEYSHLGYSYKTATSLIENVIAKKERDLFSEIERNGDLAVTSASKEYTDRKGKRVNLTPFQMKLVTAFAQVVDTLLDQEENKKYINELPFKIEERETGNCGITKKLPNSIRTVIDIQDLTKLMYSKKKVGGYQTDKVREEIKNLSEITQIYKFKDGRGGTLTIEAPLITLGKRIKYETKDGVVKINRLEVSFEDVFVYEINDKYSLSPITLLQLWNSTGVQTELFTMLLFLLQSVRGHYSKHAEDTIAAKRAELKKARKEAKEIEEELAKLKRERLTYKESITSLLERIDSKRYTKGKYLRFDNLNKDLKQASEALIRIGIVSDYYETTGASGEIICNFVINDKWLTDEANRNKASLPKEGKEDSEKEGTEGGEN